MFPLLRHRGVLRQLLAVVSGNLSMVAAAIVMSWSSPALPKLPHLTHTESSWVGSLPCLGAAFGPWLGGWLADLVGRRTTALLGALPILGSWVALLFVEYAPTWLCVVRFVSGVGVGIVFGGMPTYVGEITQANVRGAMGSFMMISMGVGYMIDYSVGPFVSYRTLAFIGMAAPVVFMACFFWMPESPYYLLAVGKDREAEDALRWLRDEDRDIVSELSEMKKGVEESRLKEASVLDLFRTRRSRRAVAIALGVVCSEQVAGINAVLFYTQDIFSDAGGDVDSRVGPIIISGIMLVESAIAGPLLVDRLGRRILLISSSTLMSVAHIALAVYFYLGETGHSVENIGWLPIVALVFYVVVYTPGYGCLPFTVAGEVFAPNVKIVAMPLAACASWFMSFVVTRFYEDIALAVGNSGPFFVFAGCCLCSSLYVYFFVPETKRKTLEEIQAMLEQ